MNDTAPTWRRSRSPAVAPPPDDLRHGVRLERELHPADQPRRGGARQGLADRQDARRPVAEARRTPGRCSASCGRSPASSSSSWAPRWATSWSGARNAAWTGACSTTRQRGGGIRRLVKDLNRVYRETPALWTQDTSPSGFRWITSEDSQHNTFSFLRFAPNGDAAGLRGELRGGPARELPHRPAAGRRLAARSINTDSELYGGSGVGNLGEVQAEEQPVARAQPSRSRCGCRRWARSGSNRRKAGARVRCQPGLSLRRWPGHRSRWHDELPPARRRPRCDVHGSRRWCHPRHRPGVRRHRPELRRHLRGEGRQAHQRQPGQERLRGRCGPTSS